MTPPPAHAEETWRPARPAPALLREPRGPGDEPTRPSGISRVLYLLLALIPVMLGAMVVLVRTGVLDQTSRTSRAPWDLAIVLLAGGISILMAAVVARRAPALHERSRGDGFDRGLAAAELWTMIGITPVAFLFAGLGLAAWSGTLDRVPAAAHPMAGPLLAAFSILVAGAPAAWFSLATARRKRAVEERFPDLLRDLNESYAAGMTMSQAIRVASRGDYGALNPEIQRMANQLSWGTPFPEALRMFSDRVRTPLVTRAVALIVKATRAGGNVKDVLAAAARDAREIKAIENDRRGGMALYVIVVYVAFGVFLAVTAALQGLLIPSVLQATQGVSGIGNVALPNRLTLVDFQHVYFSVGLIQAIGSGLVAGVMSEGSLSAGLRHGAILVAVTILVLGGLL